MKSKPEIYSDAEWRMVQGYMRAIVAYKLGDEVEVPGELMG